MIVSTSKTNIHRRLDLFRDDFINSNSKKKTYVLYKKTNKTNKTINQINKENLEKWNEKI